MHGMLQGKPGLYRAHNWASRTGVEAPSTPEFKAEWARTVRMTEPFPLRATTTRRLRAGTAPGVTGTKSAVVGGPSPPAPAASPARCERGAFANDVGYDLKYQVSVWAM